MGKGTPFALITHFNSRPSARGDPAVTGATENDGSFQFTPLREGRLIHRWDGGQVNHISIHAPPRGATSVAAACVIY